MYPQAEIPVTQISLLQGLDAGKHVTMGKALSLLKERNILIVGSGFSIHNMNLFSTNMENQDDPLNNEFQEWLIHINTQIEDPEERASLLTKWEEAPGARYCHPREEHLLPLHVCAGISDKKAELIFDDFILGKRSVAFKF
jgi:aromatic ring-opening dioxygenase catalytic subunit (LigB family)